MRNGIIKVFIFICVVCAFIFTSKVSAEAAVRLSKSKKSIYEGQTYTLKLKGIKEKNRKKVAWSSSNKSVASVSSAGTVTAVKSGKAVITATYKGKSYKCSITVKANSETEYTIVCKDIYNRPLSGVRVSVCEGDTCMMKTSDSAGKIVFKGTSKSYTVKVLSSAGKVPNRSSIVTERSTTIYSLVFTDK